jgi:hypothetical protein
MSIDGIPLNCYLNYNPTNGRVEIVKSMPPGVLDELVMDFSSPTAAWAWATEEFHAGRMPLTVPVG